MDSTTGKNIQNLPGHKSFITNMRLSSDGNYLATSSLDGTARVWDLNTYQQIVELKNYDGVLDKDNSQLHTIRKAAFSPDGQFIATASDDGSVKIWEVKTGRLIGKPLEGHSKAVMDVNFSNDGKFIITASSDTTAKIWDAQTGQLLLNLDESKEELRAAVFAPNDKFIITIGADNFVRIYLREIFAPLNELQKIAEQRLMLDFQNEEFLRILGE